MNKLIEKAYLVTVKERDRGFYKVKPSLTNENIIVVEPDGNEVEYDNYIFQGLNANYHARLEKITDKIYSGLITYREFLLQYLEAFAEEVMDMKVFMRCCPDDESFPGV